MTPYRLRSFPENREFVRQIARISLFRAGVWPNKRRVSRSLQAAPGSMRIPRRWQGFFATPNREKRGRPSTLAKHEGLIYFQPPLTGERMTTPPDRPAGSVDPKLLEILVCPLTKSTLEYDAEKQELISRAAKLAYPIRDGIPIMLPEEARPLE